MKTRLIYGIIPPLLLASLFIVTPAYAQAIIGNGFLNITDVQYSPTDFGPCQYYGFDVKLEYTLTIHWSSKTYPNGDVRQTLTASGTVDIYDVRDLSNPVDSRRCSVSLSFYDVGGDSCIGDPGEFYAVDWNSVENMEQLYHVHQVTGVYIRQAWVQNGIGGGKVIAFTNPPNVLIVDE